jgi:hypothetical protein
MAWLVTDSPLAFAFRLAMTQKSTPKFSALDLIGSTMMTRAILFIILKN